MRNSHMEEVQPLRKAEVSGEDVSVPPAPMAQEQSWRCGSVVDITITVGVCVLYTLVGPLLILNNKYLLTSGFPHPIVLTSLTQAATVVFAVARRDRPPSFWQESDPLSLARPPIAAPAPVRVPRTR